MFLIAVYCTDSSVVMSEESKLVIVFQLIFILLKSIQCDVSRINLKWKLKFSVSSMQFSSKLC